MLAVGSFRAKIAWDLVLRQPYAYGALEAADIAAANGFSSVSLVEVGVASGAGLMNLAAIAARVSEETGIRCEVHGFDTGSGMPQAVDFRDHPDLYRQGDFGMNRDVLQAALPPETQLHLGQLPETIPRFLDRLPEASPIGFVALDVDYWSSTVQALELLKGEPRKYLPRTIVYVDDITLNQHNSAAGAHLAISEFNAELSRRQLESHRFLENQRVFRRTPWLKQTMFLHVLDHPLRSSPAPAPVARYIENPYLGAPQPKELFHPDTPSDEKRAG